MSVEVEGKRQQWTERRLVVRSVRHAEAAEAALRTRVAKATAQVEALNLRGRGRKRFAEIKPLRQAVTAIVQHPASRTFCGCATTSTPRRSRSERITSGPRM